MPQTNPNNNGHSFLHNVGQMVDHSMQVLEIEAPLAEAIKACHAVLQCELRAFS